MMNLMSEIVELIFQEIIENPSIYMWHPLCNCNELLSVHQSVLHMVADDIPGAYQSALRVLDFILPSQNHVKVVKVLEENLNAKCEVYENENILYLRNLNRMEISHALLCLRNGWVFSNQERPWFVEALCKIKDITPLRAVTSLRSVCKTWYYLIKPSWEYFSSNSRIYLTNRKQYQKSQFHKYILAKHLHNPTTTIKIYSIKIMPAGRLRVSVAAFPCRFGRSIQLVYTRNNWNSVEVQNFDFRRIVLEGYEQWRIIVRGDWNSTIRESFLAVKLLDNDGYCIWDNNGGKNFRIGNTETIRGLFKPSNFSLV